MNESRPLIGITHSANQSFIVIWAMKLVVWLAGGIPMSITTKQNASRFDYDGLILGGGVDINPERYGKEKKLHYAYDLERDQLEFDHFAHADKKGLPVLGVCRGAQLMNVARGGTLHIDVEKFYEKAKYPSTIIGYIFFRKTIHIENPSMLFSLFKRRTARVNSLHKQSIESLGDNFKISALEKNKIIQCIEDDRKPFFIGVQFHPEFLIYKKGCLRLFQALIRASKS